MVDPIVAVLSDHLEQEDIGSIVVIGAGPGEGISACLASTARNIVLIEPHPDLAARLRDGPGTDPRVQVHAVAVAAQEGQAPLRVFNLQPLSSLRAPRDLRQLYPGLRQIEEFSVKTVPLRQVLDGLPAGKTGCDLLVIDAPGEEGVIVSALLEAPERTRFGTILIRGGQSEHYEGSTPLGPLAETLKQAGFRPGLPIDDDPDRPCLSFRLDRLTLENTALQTRIGVLEAELKQAHATDRTRQSALEALRTSGQDADRMQGRIDALAQKAATLEASLEQSWLAAQEAEAVTVDLHARLENRQTILRDTEAARDQALADLARQEAETETLRQQAATREDELQAAQAEAKAAQAELGEVQTVNTSLRDEAEATRRQISENATGQAKTAAALADHERKIGALEAELKASAAQVHDLTTQLQSARTDCQALKAERDTAQGQTRAAQQGTKAAQEDRDRLARQLTETSTKLTGITGQMEAAKTRHEADLTAARDRIQAIEKDLAASTTTTEQARRDLALAMRMQSMAQSDLRHLQDRYAQLQEVKQQQEALLRKLTPRLQEAAQYLHGLGSLPPKDSTAPHATLAEAPSETAAAPGKSDRPAKAGRKSKASRRGKAG